MKQRYDVLATWVGKNVKLHAARWLVGKREYTQTPCGKDVDFFSLVYAYPPSPWWIAPGNPMTWCEKCRSALIARLDEMSVAPVCNTGLKVQKGGE